MIRQTLITAALAAALILPASAAPRDKADGWRNWTERAERIFVAIQSGESARLDSACKGVTGTVIGQGFQFPRWGQALIQVCTVTQAAYHGSNNNKRSKTICKDLRTVSGQIGKATDVPEGPGARDVAIRLSRIMIEIRDQMCVNFR
jgi:uncharacterized membrane protein